MTRHPPATTNSDIRTLHVAPDAIDAAANDQRFTITVVRGPIVGVGVKLGTTGNVEARRQQYAEAFGAAITVVSQRGTYLTEKQRLRAFARDRMKFPSGDKPDGWTEVLDPTDRVLLWVLVCVLSAWLGIDGTYKLECDFAAALRSLCWAYLRRWDRTPQAPQEQRAKAA